MRPLLLIFSHGLLPSVGLSPLLIFSHVGPFSLLLCLLVLFFSKPEHPSLSLALFLGMWWTLHLFQFLFYLNGLFFARVLLLRKIPNYNHQAHVFGGGVRTSSLWVVVSLFLGLLLCLLVFLSIFQQADAEHASVRLPFHYLLESGVHFWVLLRNYPFWWRNKSHSKHQAPLPSPFSFR